VRRFSSEEFARKLLVIASHLAGKPAGDPIAAKAEAKSA